jgi:hypothetical protein
MVEYLPSKHKTLGLILGTTHKKKFFASEFFSFYLLIYLFNTLVVLGLVLEWKNQNGQRT